MAEPGVVARVRVEEGELEGEIVDGLAVFRGVPFAEAPFGPLRFRPPRRRSAWEGVRPAVEPGVAAPQPLSASTTGPYWSATECGEDCLTAQIWTPDPGANGLPVIVWIHGGGYISGAGSIPAYDGRAFARDGVVHVALNYRLGVDGFLYLGEGTDNLGLRDQVAGLEWVQRNISAFGGDPGNVTVYGESGGAVSVQALLAMPSARGLFHRAISQSGTSLASQSVQRAEQTAAQFARRVGVEATREGLLGVPWSRTAAETEPFALKFLTGFLRHGSESLLISPFRTTHGTETLPEAPATAGISSPLPLLAGTNRNETSGFVAGTDLSRGPARILGRHLLRLMKVNGRIAAAYRTDPRRIADTHRLVEAAWTDWAFRMPTIRLVEARSAPTWLYEFRWQPATLPTGLGSLHGLEIPFVQDDLAQIPADGPGHLGIDDPPSHLATEMHAAWVRFATTGDPGWSHYDKKERRTMVFDNHSILISDAAAPERAAWEAQR